MLLRIYDDDSSRSAYTYSATSATTAGLGFFIYPLLGMLSDSWGRRVFILSSLLGCLLSFAALGIFGTVAALWFAASLRGITDVSFTMAFAVLGDVTTTPKFVSTYGKLQACTGLGVILGPIIAVIMEQVDKTHLPFLVCAGITAFNIVYVSLRVPETLGTQQREAREAEEREFEQAGPPSDSSTSMHSSSDSQLPGPAAHPSRRLVRSPPFTRPTLKQLYAQRSLNPFSPLKLLRVNPARTGLGAALFVHTVCQ
jgi:MFS family permease